MNPADQLQDTALRYFLEVVRCGSISEAAARLNVTASAVSRQIGSLEALLETPLFERRPRGVVPSPAGEVLAAHAQRAALEADRAVSDIRALHGLQRGRVRVASAPGFAIDFMPRMVAEYQATAPGVHMVLQVARPAEVTASVLNGDADLGITYSRVAEKDIRVEYRQPAPVMAIARPDHPLAGRGSVTLAQLKGYPMALPDASNTVRQLFDIACSHRQVAFDPVLVSNHFDTLMNYVRHSGALSISGELTVRHRIRDGEIVALPIREPHLGSRALELQTLARRTLPASARHFLDWLKARLPAPG